MAANSAIGLMLVAMGWGSIACAVGMLIYGIRFFKKMATIRQ
jgi:hypothetical protein